jgi:hypothetical protein
MDKKAKPELTVKNLKTAEFASRDYLCFECTVYVNGERAFTAENDGRGGCNLYRGINERGRELLNQCEEYAKTETFTINNISCESDLDILLSQVIEDILRKREMARWCRKKTVFRLPTDPEGSYKTYNRPFSPEMKAYLPKQYPDAIIMNETL